MSIEFVAALVPILLGTVALMLGLLLIYHFKKQQVFKQRNYRIINQIDDELRELQFTLFAMAGNRKTAYWLVEQERSRRPGKPEWWYWKAAIDMLEMDRRRWD